MTSEELSTPQLVANVLRAASGPLTLDEIIARIEAIQPMQSKNPRGRVRSAISNLMEASTLGGRPAHYTWWPNHLPGSSFRHPLTEEDLSTGSLAPDQDTLMALWPDYFNRTDSAERSRGEVTLELTGGPRLEIGIASLGNGQGIPPNPTLANWYGREGADIGDDLIIRPLDIAERRYAVSLERRGKRDEAAIADRNRHLADIAERLVRQGGWDMPDFYLIPRLIGSDAYRGPVAPDPWDKALRGDLRFVVQLGYGTSVFLVKQLVDAVQADWPQVEDPFGPPHPPGKWDGAHDEPERRAWAELLFSQGMEYRWANENRWAEACYRAALQLDPEHADAWVHLGNLRFEENLVDEALDRYRRAQAAAEARTIGDPDTYGRPFWLDLDSRPYMRALHGTGLCLWRLGRTEEAREVFTRMLALNPSDNLGARFLLPDLEDGLSWEEMMRKEKGLNH